MQDLAKLNELAEAEIDALKSEGIEPTPAEIVELNALAWRVETPETRLLLARGYPVEIGGVFLWPLTLYAQEWLDRVGFQLPTESLRECALAYAMCHARDEGEPLRITGASAKREVKRFVSALRCTRQEMVVACSQVLQQDDEPELPPDPDGAAGMSLGDFSAFLAAACGGDPDFWERRCSAQYTHSVLAAIVAQNKGDGKPTSSDPRIVATRALGWAVEKIKRSRVEQ